MPETVDRSEFHLGLTMSGAISAGAYTAGVFDFLIQALDEWERARRGEIAAVDPGAIPDHRVGLKVISGASAGAITAAVGAVALADADQQPLFFDAGKTRIKCYLPKLYDAWVVRPTLVAEAAGANDFLTTTDLSGNVSEADDFSRTSLTGKPAKKASPPVTSLLNSRLLDEIAKAALDVKTVRPPRAYVSETLHIYLTLTNLRGVPYQIFFAGGDYHMMSHGDRVHYAVAGVGAWKTESAFSDIDRSRDINSAWLQNSNQDRQAWKDFTICALASAAFPVGLSPRQIYTATTEYSGAIPGDAKFRRFPDEALANLGNIQPPWPDGLSDFPFMTADGGTIDNDPFQYARFALKKKDNLLGANEPDLARADRAVIMVSPFPPEKPVQAASKPAPDIFSIASALLPSLIDQARFKPSELALAADPAYASRYLIAPRRVAADGKIALYPMASGLLGGFGGFVALSFRDHDFQLGRRNCQRFLQGTFALPPENEIISSWPASAPKDQFKAKQTQAEIAAREPDSFCVIPLFGTATEETLLPDWPRISQAQFDTLQTRIAGRFDAVAPKFLEENVAAPLRNLLQFAARPPSRFGIGLIRDKALTFVEAAILSDLVRRDQIETFANLPASAGLDDDDLRLILAELITPDRQPRSVLDIARSIPPAKAAVLSPSKIAQALEELRGTAGQPCQVWKAPWPDENGQAVYGLKNRLPNLMSRALDWTKGAIRQFKPAP